MSNRIGLGKPSDTFVLLPRKLMAAVISVTFICLTNQEKLSAWQKSKSLLFPLHVLSVSLFLLFFASPELKAVSKPVYRESHPLVLRHQIRLLNRAAASDPFFTIQTIATLILNSLRPFVSSQIAHKSIIHLEGPSKLCWLQMVLSSVFLWKAHMTVKLRIETIENIWVIMWSSCFVLQ